MNPRRSKPGIRTWNFISVNIPEHADQPFWLRISGRVKGVLVRDLHTAVTDPYAYTGTVRRLFIVVGPRTHASGTRRR